MDIIKVIVDKLPESCEDCGLWFANGLNGFGICYATKLEMSDKYLYLHRPDWCPLIGKKDAYHG